MAGAGALLISDIQVSLLAYVALYCYHGKPQLVEDSGSKYLQWVLHKVMVVVVVVLLLNLIGLVEWLW